MTIKDIAKLAGVSVSTVSKVLNKKDSDISDSTRENVLRIIKDYQYTPYSKIKSTANKSFIISLIVPRNYLYKDILVSSIEKAVTRNGYNTLIYFTDTIDDEEQYLNILTNKNIEAVLLYSLASTNYASEIMGKRDIPLILLNKDTDNKTATQVYTNYEQAGYLATIHLIKNGHSNVGLLLENNSFSDQINKGFERAHLDSNMLYDNAKIFHGKSALDAGRIGGRRLIEMHTTAIICANSDIAYSLYLNFNSLGVQIPNDVSIVGINCNEISELVVPALDSVDLAIDELGEEAVSTMIRIVEKKTPSKNYFKEVDLKLLENGSVSFPSTTSLNINKKIIVVGSMNIDVTIGVDKIPIDGETLTANSVIELPGGKGANQAVGVGKLGGLVYLIGCIGNDDNGKRIYNSLINNSVKTDCVEFDDFLATGKAFVNVASNGESSIVVFPGTNASLDIIQINNHTKLFKQSTYCLISMEVPMEAAEFAIDISRKNEVEVIVKPSTIKKIEPEVLKKINYLVPNEKEIHNLVEGDISIFKKAEILHGQGVENVIVTLGNKGCYLKNEDYSLLFNAAPFEAVDTTGAADAFISALAVYLNEGNDLILSIKYATYAAGISITRQGAQLSMPSRMDLEIYKSDIINDFKVTEVR